MTIKLFINHKTLHFDGDENTPLLWYLRDEMSLTATRFGCGKGLCGTCSVILDGKVVRSCITPLKILHNRKIITLEGIMHTKQFLLIADAWVSENVPQCGYCQSGQLISAYHLLNDVSNPSLSEVKNRLNNICRCGTYPFIHDAIIKVSKVIAGLSDE
ncbi:(2Fe-2S)-binding protein [Marinicella meishanensis]|uniref:(2Fe-2S)-binding protein n=1 Tax=Marinicella meishanensis TaxID=2873263 RepID=UPI001CBD3CB6|nr:(2Fe-2S)-binding protein [Marinicella sp. NBU2979]